MHVLFLAPDTHVYNHGFLRGLTGLGVTLSAIGVQPEASLSRAARDLLGGYRQCKNPLSVEELTRCAEELARTPFDRVETIDEPLVEQAAALREHFALPGPTVATARLCRDKVAMKEFLRQHDIPCAQSAAVKKAADAHEFAEREGYPLILKPLAGFGSLATFRVEDRAQLDDALQKLRPSAKRPAAIEEFIEGHEGFYDTIVGNDGVRHDFAAHYYPGCLEAANDRKVAPQIAVTNRIDGDGYRELREVGRRVIDALELRGAATHMEWFFGPKGLKFSEIGARPAGEMIWDMYRVANDFDVYREWALAILGRPSEASPSRRLAAGSIQIRPNRDGRYVRHHGLELALRRCGEFVYDMAVPAPGAPTLPLEKGWLVNTWFRVRHDDYDKVRELMTFLGDAVRVEAR